MLYGRGIETNPFKMQPHILGIIVERSDPICSFRALRNECGGVLRNKRSNARFLTLECLLDRHR